MVRRLHRLDRRRRPIARGDQEFPETRAAKITGVLTRNRARQLVRRRQGARRRIRLDHGSRSGDRHRIGLPSKMVPRCATPRTARAGRRRTAKFRSKPSASKSPASAAAAVRTAKERARHPQGREQRADATTISIISGMQGLKIFSVRARRDGEMRGFTILYDQMMETIVAPVTARWRALSRRSPSAARHSPRWRSRSNTATG